MSYLDRGNLEAYYKNLHNMFLKMEEINKEDVAVFKDVIKICVVCRFGISK